MITMKLNSDNSERVFYPLPGLLVNWGRERLSYYPHHAAAIHWHDEVEFILILSGYMSYYINGEVKLLRAGDGIFVNSRQLHFGYSADQSDCDFIFVLLHPALLCATDFIDKTYIRPVTLNGNFPYQTLCQSCDWEKEILNSILQIYNAAKGDDHLYPLMVQTLFYRIWTLIFQHNPQKAEREIQFSHQLSSLKEMVGFIQMHYSDKITIDDISTAGKVCKSNCCRIFQTHLRQTPIGYLTEYRLNKGMDLLRTTDMTISEIGYETGFSSASYFTETFHKIMGQTPREYRTIMGCKGI